jgi:flagellar export protein FliJ
MKKFVFTLEPVRALREQQEQDAQRAFVAELAKTAEREAELARAQRVLEEARAAAAAAAGAADNVESLLARRAFVERCEREVRAAQRELEFQQDNLAIVRSKLEQAAQDRETLERLKRRREEEHVAELHRLEERTLAEIGLRSHRGSPDWGDAA